MWENTGYVFQLIHLAKKYPEKSMEELGSLAHTQISSMKIELPNYLKDPLTAASTQFQSDPNMIICHALEDWLISRKFISEV
jgi:hypothetical protein